MDILFSTLQPEYCCSLSSSCSSSHAAMQFVFAITEASDQLVGGHVWRSDKYGQAGSWVDVTQQMEGMPHVLRLALVA